MAQGADTIILGCTHFPHLAPIIQSVCGNGITLIDNGYAAALEAKQTLKDLNIKNEENRKGTIKYFVSDKAQNFSSIAKNLLGIDISNNVSVVEVAKAE